VVGLAEVIGRQPRIGVAPGLGCWFGRLRASGFLVQVRDVGAGRNQHTEHQGDGVKSEDAHGFLRGFGSHESLAPVYRPN
jgi:hypothetical protein